MRTLNWTTFIESVAERLGSDAPLSWDVRRANELCQQFPEQFPKRYRGVDIIHFHKDGKIFITARKQSRNK